MKSSELEAYAVSGMGPRFGQPELVEMRFSCSLLHFAGVEEGYALAAFDLPLAVCPSHHRPHRPLPRH